VQRVRAPCDRSAIAGRRPGISPTRIAGYTDSTGPEGYNLLLSRERARSVREPLARRPGVNARLLRPIGLGETRPLASNATEIGRQRNRRVVVTVRLPNGVVRFWGSRRSSTSVP